MLSALYTLLVSTSVGLIGTIYFIKNENRVYKKINTLTQTLLETFKKGRDIANSITRLPDIEKKIKLIDSFIYLGLQKNIQELQGSVWERLQYLEDIVYDVFKIQRGKKGDSDTKEKVL